MIRTANEAIDLIRKLSLPVVFEQIQLGTAMELINDNCAAPKKFFMINNPPFEGMEDWLPLWEFDGEELHAYDMQKREYIRFEYSRGKKTVIGKSYQQFISRVLLEFVYAGLDDYIDELAVAFNYSHLPSFQKFVATQTDDYEQAFEEFLTMIHN